MAEHLLVPPLKEEEVRKLNVHDVVRITGVLFGVRDASLIEMFDRKRLLPVSLCGHMVLHTAPGVRKIKDSGCGESGARGKYEPVSVGTTTSMRMDRFTGPLLKAGVRGILGKGGLSCKSAELLKKHGGCYLSVIGGTAALTTSKIEEIEEVWWEELMPECLWKFKVREFGPLIVTIDARGNNLYLDVMQKLRYKNE